MNFKFCPHCGNKLILNQAGDDGLILAIKISNSISEISNICIN